MVFSGRQSCPECPNQKISGKQVLNEQQAPCNHFDQGSFGSRGPRGEGCCRKEQGPVCFHRSHDFRQNSQGNYRNRTAEQVAGALTRELSAGKDAATSGLAGAEPAVLIREGIILCGFIAPEAVTFEE